MQNVIAKLGLNAVLAFICFAGAVFAGPPDVALPARAGGADVPPGFYVRVTDNAVLTRAIEAQERHHPALSKLNGVHGSGVSWAADGSVVIKLFADASASQAGVPETIEGFPVVVEQTGGVFALNVSCEERGLRNCMPPVTAESNAVTQPWSPRDWHPRPVPIGVSAGHTDVTAGTLACRVTRGCHKYALGNAHAFANTNAGQVGDHVLQPGVTDGGVTPDDSIGTLFESVPIVMGTSILVRNKVDAAIILTDATLVGDTTRTNGYGQPRTTTVAPQVGMLVQKYGRTTSLTHGYIDTINATINVGYSGGETARFVGQIVIKSVDTSIFSSYGDSGSLIVVEGGNDDRKPVGLLFASTSDKVYTIANPINDVLAALDIDIDGDFN